MSTKVSPVVVRNDGAERHELEAPEEAIVDREPILGLALVLDKVQERQELEIRYNARKSLRAPAFNR